MKILILAFALLGALSLHAMMRSSLTQHDSDPQPQTASSHPFAHPAFGAPQEVTFSANPSASTANAIFKALPHKPIPTYAPKKPSKSAKRRHTDGDILD